MDEAIIRRYLNNFRREISPLLKSGVGMHIQAYNYSAGCVIVAQLGIDINAEDTIQPSQNLSDALSRTDLFDLSNLPDNTTIHKSQFFLSRDKIILIKNDNPTDWDDRSVRQDVKHILKLIRNNGRN